MDIPEWTWPLARSLSRLFRIVNCVVTTTSTAKVKIYAASDVEVFEEIRFSTRSKNLIDPYIIECKFS